LASEIDFLDKSNFVKYFSEDQVCFLDKYTADESYDPIKGPFRAFGDCFSFKHKGFLHSCDRIPSGLGAANLLLLHPRFRIFSHHCTDIPHLSQLMPGMPSVISQIQLSSFQIIYNFEKL
jgi:hypothetical protein